MTSQSILHLLGSLAAITLASCVGTQSAMHVSTSNFGVDIDTTPPTTEIGLSRTEVAVQPAFANGQTPSSVMSFEGRTGNGWGKGVISNFFFGTGGTFATGQAAANLTSASTTSSESSNSDEIKLNAFPSRPNIFKLLFSRRHRYRPFVENEMFPLISGTKTVYGLDVNWDPATQAPRAIKAGFNRKEISYAPLIAKKLKPTTENPEKYSIKLPSVFAGHQMNTTTEDGVKFGHLQFLATGKAAENLGNNADARGLLKKKLVESQPEKTTE
jgi:hypothetical protein